MNDGSTLNVNIIDGQFDFTDFFDECDKYGRSKRLAVKEINMIQLMIEELVVNHICKKSKNILFSIRCEKDSKDVEIELQYDGERYNPYSAPATKNLSLTIMLCLTRKCVYRYDQLNHMNIHMQLDVGDDPEIIEEN